MFILKRFDLRGNYNNIIRVLIDIDLIFTDKRGNSRSYYIVPKFKVGEDRRKSAVSQTNNICLG
jgi:hypothetical protein